MWSLTALIILGVAGTWGRHSSSLHIWYIYLIYIYFFVDRCFLFPPPFFSSSHPLPPPTQVFTTLSPMPMGSAYKYVSSLAYLFSSPKPTSRYVSLPAPDSGLTLLVKSFCSLAPTDKGNHVLNPLLSFEEKRGINDIITSESVIVPLLLLVLFLNADMTCIWEYFLAGTLVTNSWRRRVIWERRHFSRHFVSICRQFVTIN